MEIGEIDYFITTPWRNGSASDSRSEGCVFKSRRGQSKLFIQILYEMSHYLDVSTNVEVDMIENN